MKKYLIGMILSCYCGFVFADLGYYRYPDIHNDTLVFTAEGDLWLADIKSGKTQRLTTQAAQETQASISLDGTKVAYVANYEGSTEVYVIGIDGGLSKRISYENARVKVLGWTQSGEVLYSTNSHFTAPRSWELVKVNPETLSSKTLPLSDAVEATIDSDASMLYFVRFGLQLSNDNSKVYRGGAMGELWRFDLNSNIEAQQMIDMHKGSIRKPMHYKDHLYFISDASGADNLWRLNKSSGTLTQVTDYSDWPIRTANLGLNKIVFQMGADLKFLDLIDNQVKDITIKLTSDFPHMREHWLNKPLNHLTSARLAGDFDKVVLTARGHVAIAGIDKSRLIQVATKPNSRSRNAILSHDGQWVYAINDSNGELEIWQFAADGSKKSKQLTNDGNIFRWNLSLSPDGKWLAHDDKDGNVYLLNIETKKNKKIAFDKTGANPVNDMVWSSNSELLAISSVHKDQERSQIMLYSIAEEKLKTLTSVKYDSYAPAFSHDDQWLYFLSDRNFVATPSSPWGDRKMGALFDRRVQVYAYSLNKKAKFGFQKPNELMVKKVKQDSKDKKENDKKDKKKDKKEEFLVDWQGMTQRLWQLPIEAGNYSQLAVNKDTIYLKDQVNEPKSQAKILSIKIEPFAQAKEFTTGIKSFSLSDDGEKMMVQTNADAFFIVKAGDKFPSDSKMMQAQTNDWQLLINPVNEWKQIFHDTWLMHRDSLYDKNMRGLDWAAVQEKYSVLLNRITDRYELNDIFKQMIGELNTLHSQVYGGDVEIDKDSASAALLGADLIQTDAGVIVQNIYQHEFERPNTASPLSHLGVNVQNGDLIVSINGLKTPNIESVNKALRNQANKQVIIEVNRDKNNYQSIVVPVSSRQNTQLRYHHWVNTKRSKVLAADKDIGYFHLQAMGSRDIAHFTREFYNNYKKQGLIIDVRRNRGGNIGSWVLEKLLRRNWMFWETTNGSQYNNMQQSFNGHLVVLSDEFTYSDGETFVAGIKALKLGTVIGKQTTGAGVWLRDQNRVSDGGMSRVAEFPQFALDGRWLVEGHGIEPDIEVENLPHATFKGSDAQLDAAIYYLKTKISKSPKAELKGQEIP
ncbi:MAG: S41 family peptidase, partial [Marinicellaceae bacterium]